MTLFRKSPESSPGRRECKNGAARRNFCILLAIAIQGKPQKAAGRDNLQNCTGSVCDEIR